MTAVVAGSTCHSPFTIPRRGHIACVPGRCVCFGRARPYGQGPAAAHSRYGCADLCPGLHLDPGAGRHADPLGLGGQSPALYAALADPSAAGLSADHRLCDVLRGVSAFMRLAQVSDDLLLGAHCCIGHPGRHFPGRADGRSTGSRPLVVGFAGRADCTRAGCRTVSKWVALLPLRVRPVLCRFDDPNRRVGDGERQPDHGPLDHRADRGAIDLARWGWLVNLAVPMGPEFHHLRLGVHRPPDASQDGQSGASRRSGHDRLYPAQPRPIRLPMPA